MYDKISDDLNLIIKYENKPKHDENNKVTAEAAWRSECRHKIHQIKPDDIQTVFFF